MICFSGVARCSPRDLAHFAPLVTLCSGNVIDCPVHMQVACETATKTNMVMVFGEITTKAKVDYEAVVRRVCKEVGFTSDDVGLDCDKCKVLVHIEEQSPEIGASVHGMSTKALEEIGAGDQGHMFGYATDETDELMPLTHVLATKIGYRFEYTLMQLPACLCGDLVPHGASEPAPSTL